MNKYRPPVSDSPILSPEPSPSAFEHNLNHKRYHFRHVFSQIRGFDMTRNKKYLCPCSTHTLFCPRNHRHSHPNAKKVPISPERKRKLVKEKLRGGVQKSQEQMSHWPPNRAMLRRSGSKSRSGKGKENQHGGGRERQSSSSGSSRSSSSSSSSSSSGSGSSNVDSSPSAAVDNSLGDEYKDEDDFEAVSDMRCSH